MRSLCVKLAAPTVSAENALAGLPVVINAGPVLLAAMTGTISASRRVFSHRVEQIAAGVDRRAAQAHVDDLDV